MEMKSLVETFNGMIGRLENSFEHIEEFSSHVAHELKTPLTIIRGETELALRGEHDSKEYRRALMITVSETGKMLKIIEDLLYLAKLDYQPELFKLERINFLDFFRETEEEIKMLASIRKIKIESEIPSSGPLMVKADKLHLRRLFFNLVDNALKFTPVSGSIHLKVSRRDTQVVISIADTGKGISEQNLLKIFDKFFREDHRAVGTGLGLSIAQSIAKIHQGSIRVSSKLNQGTVFTVVLPLV
jgi:signal transduction histidine kinase